MDQVQSPNHMAMASNPEQVLLQYLLYIGLLILLLFGLAYLYYWTQGCHGAIPFIDFLKNGLSVQGCVPPTLTPLDIHIGPIGRKEVFHISDQIYTYEEAKCKCAAYGGRLATESEIIAAYNNGAHWCTYGWSQGQNAFFPVNEPGPGCKHRKGVHGGYFPNPELRFGINCYGVKPAGSIPKKPGNSHNDTPFCQRPGIKEHVSKDLGDTIVGFNSGRWSA